MASLVFYAVGRPANLLLLLPSIGANYLLGQSLLKKPRKVLLVAGVAGNILLIAYFKYLGFLVANLDSLTGSAYAIPDIVLPLGISFFTLHQICYLIDSYHGKTKPTPLSHYVLYVTFFPQLIAGPIVRFTEVMDQYDDPRFGRFDATRLAQGMLLLCIGLAKKVLLADYFATVASPVFAAAQDGLGLNGLQAWMASISYSFQIYFDFSAYSDMALGLGLFFGIQLPVNFNSPYQATSIIDFWRRWHMTLSRFLRDYLYIPLGGSRLGEGRRYLNLMIVMLIGGLWHGAAWTFVIWGGLHGFYLLMNHAWHRLVPPRPDGGAFRTPATIFTFLLVTVAWVFFRAPTVFAAATMLRTMFGVSSGPSAPLVMDWSAWMMAFLGGYVIWGLPNSLNIAARFRGLGAEDRLKWRAASVAFGAIAGLAIFLIFTGTKSEFIYFQF
ncbi:MAG: MBOAT family protein [Pseudomonadota bacterium]|nr:MBOAT family protein [Pseudomonadota bacterium]